MKAAVYYSYYSARFYRKQIREANDGIETYMADMHVCYKAMKAL